MERREREREKSRGVVKRVGKGGGNERGAVGEGRERTE
jgi:hypothetical protein